MYINKYKSIIPAIVTLLQVVWCGRIASTPKNQPTKSTRTTGTGNNNTPDIV